MCSSFHSFRNSCRSPHTTGNRTNSVHLTYSPLCLSEDCLASAAVTTTPNHLSTLSFEVVPASLFRCSLEHTDSSVLTEISSWTSTVHCQAGMILREALIPPFSNSGSPETLKPPFPCITVQVVVAKAF